jgi:hypothetical protein
MTYNAGGKAGKEPHKIVAPHELSSKFLFRMRREDRPAALAFLDQQTLLRHVFRKIHSLTITSVCFSSHRVAARRSFDWTRSETETDTTGDRATR